MAITSGEKMRKPHANQVVGKYVFMCKVGTSGKDKLGKKRAVIAVPRKFWDELAGKKVIVTVEVLR